MARLEARAVISAEDRTRGIFERIGARLRALGRSSQRVSAATAAGVARQVDTNTRAMRAIEKAQKVNGAMFAAGAGMRGGAGMLGVAAGAGLRGMPGLPALGAGFGVYKVTQDALSFEKAMTEVQKATDVDAGGLKKYEQGIIDLSVATGKTREELASMMSAAGFAGRPVQDLARFTEYAAKATNAWQMPAEQTGQALAELGNIYKANQTRLEEIGDAVNTAADISAARESDLLEFIRRTGATGQMLGMSAEQTLAFGAALKEVGVTSEVAATGFNAMLTKIASKPEDLADDLKGLGINAKKFGALVKKDATGAIMLLLKQIDKLGDGTEKIQKLEGLFGREYADDIAKMAGNIGGIEKVLTKLGDRANYVGSTMQNFELVKDTDYNRLARFQQAVEALGMRFGSIFKSVGGAIGEGLIEPLMRAEQVLKELERRGSEGWNQKTPPGQGLSNEALDKLNRYEQAIRGEIAQSDAEQGKADAAKRTHQLYGDIATSEAAIVENERIARARPWERGTRDRFNARHQEKIEGAHRQIEELNRASIEIEKAQEALQAHEAARKGYEASRFAHPGAAGPLDRGAGIQTFRSTLTGYAMPPQTAPLPPRRPGAPQAGIVGAPAADALDWGKAPDIDAMNDKLREVESIIEDISGKSIAPQTDASQVESLKDTTGLASTALDDLNKTVTPTVNASSLQSALTIAQQLNAELAKVGPGATAAEGAMRRVAAAKAAGQQSASVAPRPHALRTTFIERERFAFG